MNAFLQKLEHSLDFWFLLTTSFVFFLLRLPSFFEPYWYGDEGVYEVLGFGMRHGRLLYQGVWDNKPPLLYLIYAAFDGNQMMVRIASFIVGLVAVYIFYVLAKLLFEQKKSVFLATGFFALFLGLPFIEGNIANAENFMILPAVAAAYLLVRLVKDKNTKLFIPFIAGLLLGISFLIKIVAVFDFASFFLIVGFAFFALNKSVLWKLFLQLGSFSVGFFIPFLATLGFFAYKGILKIFIQSAFLSNVGYVNYGNQFFLPFTHIAIPQGLLLVKLFFVLLVIAFVFWKRKSLTLLQIVLYIWLPFSLFNAFFSGRPYTHYVLVLLPTLSLLVGSLFEKYWRIIHATTFLVALLLLTNFWYYGKIPGYYQNFVQFVLGQKSNSAYESFFDKGVVRDYAIADFLKRNLKPNQKVFIWTNSAQIYYLIGRLPLGRYTVAYHMNANDATRNETALDLRKNNPDFVVLLPNAPMFPFAMDGYKFRVDINGGLIYEKVF